MSSLFPRTDPNRFAIPSILMPKVICRRCKKKVESVSIAEFQKVLGGANLEVRCHGQKQVVTVATLDPMKAAYTPEIEAFQPVSERGKAVRRFASAKRNGWRHQ